MKRARERWRRRRKWGKVGEEERERRGGEGGEGGGSSQRRVLHMGEGRERWHIRKNEVLVGWWYGSVIQAPRKLRQRDAISRNV